MRNKLFFLFVGLALMALAASSIARVGAPSVAKAASLQQGTASEVSAPRTLSVNGVGRVTLDPDIAYIYIGVQTENKDAAEAVTENGGKAQNVADALKTLKIDPKDIQTTNFSIFPQQQFDEQGKQTGTTYVVNNTVYVTLRDLEAVGEIIDTAVKAGANSINNIQFDVADRSTALSEARKAAVVDARQQAEELAEAAGVKLVAVQTLSSYSSGVPMPIADGKGGGAFLADAAAAPISAGQLILQVDVSLVYIIE